MVVPFHADRGGVGFGDRRTHPGRTRQAPPRTVVRMSTRNPRTLAEDLRSRTDADLGQLLMARPDLGRPIPSDMRALTTRAATAPSIARYLDTVDALHHFALRIATEHTSDGPTTTADLAEALVAVLGEDSRSAVGEAIRSLWLAALLWGSHTTTNVVTAVRDQVAHAMQPIWPPPLSDLEHSANDDVTIDTHAITQVQSTLSLIEEIAEYWQREPGAAVQSGGLSTRSLDILTTRLRMDESTVHTVLDVAYSAGLIALGPMDSDIGWMPTHKYDEWCLLSAGERWIALSRAWLDRPWITAQRPLTFDENPFARSWRDHLMEVLSDQPCTREAALRIIDFRWPRRSGSKRTEIIEKTWREAEILGVIADAHLSGFGRALVSGSSDSKILTHLRRQLAAPVDKVHVQADFTIVVPGPLEPSIGARLREIADVESRGHASVLRLTNASARRALEVEPDATVWLDFLQDISLTPIPQPVSYLITDAARSEQSRKGRFRAPTPTRLFTKPRKSTSNADIEKVVRVLRSHETHTIHSDDDAPLVPDDIPRMDTAAVVAQLKYAIDHNETVCLSHAESDGTIATLLVDPIRLGGGSLSAYDHRAEQVRTLAISRISGALPLRVSA